MTTDLPARLEAVLTERFTELGNPFSAMRRQEKGPDGWPASHPVGPSHVADALRELLAADPAPVSSAPADQAARWQQYADAMDAVTGGTCPADLVNAVMAVADAELARAQAEAYQYRTALQGAARAAASSPPAVPVFDDLLAAQLAPLEAQARAGREQQRAQHRAEVLREAADHLDTRAASVGDVSDDPAIFVAKARIHDAAVWREAATELRRLAACQECQWGVEHTEHCPYPESHNWGCGCPTDQAPASGPGGVAGETQQPERKACTCSHPADEHGVYGCADDCGCEWMPKRRAPMDPVHILGIYADGQPEVHGALLATRCDACRHTLNWHRNDVGCTVVLCVCGHFQEPAAVSQPETEA